jgi:hypothetical protein
MKTGIAMWVRYLPREPIWGNLKMVVWSQKITKAFIYYTFLNKVSFKLNIVYRNTIMPEILGPAKLKYSTAYATVVQEQTITLKIYGG